MKEIRNYHIPVIIIGDHPHNVGSHYLWAKAEFSPDEKKCYVEYDRENNWCMDAAIRLQEEYELNWSNEWENKNYPEIKFDIKSDIDIQIVKYEGKNTYLIFNCGETGLLVVPPVEENRPVFDVFIAHWNECTHEYENFDKWQGEYKRSGLALGYTDLYYISEKLKTLSEVYMLDYPLPKNFEICENPYEE